MRNSDRRMAFLCTEDETGRTTTKVADFGAMSLSIRTSGGYDTPDEQTRSITPDAVDAFWSTYSEILPLRGGDRDQVGGATWDAKFFDGEIIRTERGSCLCRMGSVLHFAFTYHCCLFDLHLRLFLHGELNRICRRFRT